MKENAFLQFHDYSFFEYEKVLARLEIENYVGAKVLEEKDEGIFISSKFDLEKVDRLTYFKSLITGGKTIDLTQQKLESLKKQKRQSTRYSAHGIHEYKGKFNPQIVRAILNIHNIQEGQFVLDPFCGSGTTLLESQFSGLNVAGIDINPLATFIAAAKLGSVGSNAHDLTIYFNKFIKSFNKVKLKAKESEREIYLKNWFPEEIFIKIEKMRAYLEEGSEPGFRNIILVLISDVIKDFSFQDPADLRIRRRRDPITNMNIEGAIEEKFVKFAKELEHSNHLFGKSFGRSVQLINDNIAGSNLTESHSFETKFDIAITSPPYATALPYIDTQRLSLVWLSLLPPSKLRSKEANLIGTREFNSDKSQWVVSFNKNSHELSDKAYDYCLTLKKSLNSSDGFRRQAVPYLVYKYLAEMKAMFTNVHSLLKNGAPFALVVGHNQTTLGGTKFDINTPELLIEVATHSGWILDKVIPLDVYKRYGLNYKNSVNHEDLIVLRKNGRVRPSSKCLQH